MSVLVSDVVFSDAVGEAPMEPQAVSCRGSVLVRDLANNLQAGRWVPLAMLMVEVNPDVCRCHMEEAWPTLLEALNNYCLRVKIAHPTDYLRVG